MGRPRTGYDVPLRFGARPEVAEALARLTESSGLSRAHVLRVAVEQFLVEAGVLMPVDLAPTLTAGSHPTRRM